MEVLCRRSRSSDFPCLPSHRFRFRFGSLPCGSRKAPPLVASLGSDDDVVAISRKAVALVHSASGFGADEGAAATSGGTLSSGPPRAGRRRSCPPRNAAFPRWALVFEHRSGPITRSREAKTGRDPRQLRRRGRGTGAAGRGSHLFADPASQGSVDVQGSASQRGGGRRGRPADLRHRVAQRTVCRRTRSSESHAMARRGAGAPSRAESRALGERGEPRMLRTSRRVDSRRPGRVDQRRGLPHSRMSQLKTRSTRAEKSSLSSFQPGCRPSSTTRRPPTKTSRTS